jgi:hypothetical protein
LTAYRLILTSLLVAAACGGDDDDDADAAPGVDAGVALFPADYAESYTEVRDCRRSGEHRLNIIRVLADPDALAPYRDRDAPFPVGAVVLKEEHDPADSACEEPPTRWTVMVKLGEGADPDRLDWRWQDVDADRSVLSEDQSLCYGCHESCGNPPDGYDGTCTVP